MLSANYGSFAAVMMYVAVLVTVFSTLLFKAVGKVSQWTYLADDAPAFMVTAGVRALAVALIVLTFIFIDKGNYVWFGSGAAVCGLLLIGLIGWFDSFRKAHICRVPLLNPDGSEKRGWFGAQKVRTVVVGSENDMKPQAAAAYAQFGGGALCKFLSGYGQNEINNPDAIWTRKNLAGISSRMTMMLIGILLCAVMTIYLAASAFEVHQRL